MASRKTRRWPGIVVLAALLGGGGGYLYYTKFMQTRTVTATTIAIAPVSEAVFGTGTVEPERWAKVVPLQRARLLELCLCEGQSVAAGQQLARQDDAEDRSALQQLQIEHDQLERDWHRAQDEHNSNSRYDQSQVDQARARFDESTSRIAAQQARLDGYVLRAPLSGMVLRRDGEIGEIVGPTDVLFWIGEPAPMHLVAEINEEEIPKIAVGQKALLRTEAFADQALPATVSQITPKGDPTRKTFRVYLRLPPNTPLRIGMTCEANIIYREKASAMVVPAEAVSSNSVEVVDAGRVKRVPVDVGIKGTRTVEIIGDVAPNAIVLTPARTDLADGARVEVKLQPNPAAKEQINPPTAVSTQPRAPAVVDAAPARPAPVAAPPGPTLASSNSGVTSVPTQPAARAPTTDSIPTDPNDALLASELTAHIDTVVNDARRNVGDFAGRR